MTSGNAFDGPDATLFSARLVPHRSLTRTGFVVLMAVVSVVSFAAGMVFLVMGAWPVFAFFGLDALLIYASFRINFRDARAVEEISMTYSELCVRKTDPRGDVMEWTLNPLWVRLDHFAHAEFGIQELYLSSRAQRIAVGKCLGPDEKASFFKALSTALGAAKRGPVYNPLT